MAGNLNKLLLIGRLTVNPSIIKRVDGTSFSTFILANNRHYKSGDTKKIESSLFSCVAWNTLGELMAKNCKKNQLIRITGRVQQRLWKDIDEKMQSTFEVVVEEFEILDNKED